MQSNWKTQLAKVLAAARLIFHWSYIPFVIYLGKLIIILK
jgi:hypothetical protein